MYQFIGYIRPSPWAILSQSPRPKQVNNEFISNSADSRIDMQ